MIGSGSVEGGLYLTRQFRRTGTHTVYSVDLKYLICVMFINSLLDVRGRTRATLKESTCLCPCLERLGNPLNLLRARDWGL